MMIPWITQNRKLLYSHNMHASVQSHEYIPSDSVDMWAMAILIFIKKSLM
jgi:hypothetical protein